MGSGDLNTGPGGVQGVLSPLPLMSPREFFTVASVLSQDCPRLSDLVVCPEPCPQVVCPGPCL